MSESTLPDPKEFAEALRTKNRDQRLEIINIALCQTQDVAILGWNARMVTAVREAGLWPTQQT